MDALVLLASSDASLLEMVQSYAWMILSVAAGLGFVIFVHELGHFLVAKACGVKCEKFYIGFDIFNLRFCRFQWGETEYGIGALPLGGYVKMLGQDDDPRNAMAEAERCKVAAESSDAARAAALAEGTSAEGLTPAATVEQPQAEAKYELDPRSYPAKSVPARMAIISAGVIMNVIFGAVLAAWAYWLGVEELPAIVGSTVPGGPAWTANLRPGMKFVRFGDGPVYENYRFVDVKQNIIFGGAGENLEFTVRTRDGDEKTFVLRPTARAKKETKFPTIGYHLADSTVLMERVDHLKPRADVELQAGDRIIEINGIKLNKGTPTHEVFDYRLNAELARSATRPVTLTIERQSEAKSGEPGKPQRLQVKVERKPNRTVGMVMQIGPIVAIRDGSPAQQAGFQVGDIIQEVNGNPVGDPLSLGQRLIPQNETEQWTFVVARKAAGATVTRTLTVTPQPPDQYFEQFSVGGPASIESIGVAFAVTHKVAAVDPGSAAQKAGIKPGDVVTKAALVPASDVDGQKERGFYGKEIHQEVVLDDDVFSWTRIHFRLQLVLPTTALRVTIKRGNREIEAMLAPQASETFFSETRGLAFAPVVTTHQASSLGESLYLGVREIKEGMVNVVATVSALFTGKVSSEHVTGPLGILQTAGRIAQSGLPELLIFLTLLSANLAVLNILPIPVLDGGHLLFLTWEGITRKPVNPNVQGYLSLVGLVLLLLLMIYATKNDIMRWVS